MTEKEYYHLREQIRILETAADAYFQCEDNTDGQKDEALESFIAQMGVFVIHVENMLDEERYLLNIDMDEEPCDMEDKLPSEWK